MKSLSLYQKYAIILFLSCIGFTLSFLICTYFLLEIKILIAVCSIFLFSMIFSFTGFHFSYENHLNSLKTKKDRLNKIKTKKNIIYNSNFYSYYNFNMHPKKIIA